MPLTPNAYYEIIKRVIKWNEIKDNEGNKQKVEG
jgi:hypothetical protein